MHEECVPSTSSYLPKHLVISVVCVTQVLMVDLHYRITRLLPRPSGGQLLLVLHTKCMGSDYRGL